ncbi:hypothetical protein MYAM1_003739 [Malassezia yamatoensis]|uniref:CRA domain-containing protein n=1 Tax=Malassezia yamatoensis TaxID=253288 RepID=A0AAJ6CJN6_9BASI|nr:hypothetical protein MYAM1_003739 [Malassezia yamatoensis]
MNDAAVVDGVELDSIVMDYLVHYGHLNTVSALLSDDFSDDTQGLASEQIAQITARQAEICQLVVEGRIEEALDRCQRQFTGVISDEATTSRPEPEQNYPPSPVSLDAFHVWLNMHIQHFVELVRELYDEYASEPGQNSIQESPKMQKALSELQRLHARIQTLPADERGIYQQQIQALAALLAYSHLEEVPDQRVFDLHRRSALALQVNSAILAHTGHLPESVLAYVARQTACLLDTLHTQKVQVPRCHPLVALTEKAYATSQNGASSIPCSPLLPKDTAATFKADDPAELPREIDSDERVTILPWRDVVFFHS